MLSLKSIILRNRQKVWNVNTITFLSSIAFYVSICLLFASCITQSELLEMALEQAGNNKKELLKVLDYYDSQERDSLKYKAARFLIANMLSHGCVYYQGIAIEKAKQEFKKNRFVSEKNKKALGLLQKTKKSIKSDLNTITSDYLINNIELAFAQWNKRPWKKYYTFDEFCEYILPYRISTEPLQNWREECIKRYGYLLDSLYVGSDVVEATKVICSKLKEEDFTWTMEFSGLGCAPPLFNIANRVGSCFDAVSVATYVLRSLGVPTHIDSYRFSPETFASHSWNVVLDTTKINIPFYYMEYYPERGRKEADERKKIKVFRNTFAYRPVERDSFLQGLVQTNQLDVSKEYFNKSLVLPIRDTDKEYYLCSFRQEQIVPILKGVVKNKKVDFGIVESGNIFVLASFSCKTGGLKIESDAFLFKDGLCHLLKAEPKKKELAVLYRKSPLSKWGWGRLLRTIGANFYGGNSLNRIDEKLFSICDTPLVARNEYPFLSTQKKYRYIKYAVRKEVPLELSEIALYDGKKKLKIHNVIAGESYDAKDPEMQLNNAFDGNPISYFLSKNKGDSIIIDLGKSQRITKAVCTPRNDNNFIHIGDEYALYYFTKNSGWKMLLRTVAKSETISCNIPHNALLLLKDKANGKGEQIFLYRNGQQIYLNML